MTARRKAKELFNKYFNDVKYMDDNYLREIECKQCALICVNEILAIDDMKPYQIAGFQIKYWNDVKEEIEKLKI